MRKATSKEIPEIRLLWQAVFKDSEDYVNSFIAHFGIENCYVSKQSGEIASMVFALPVAVSGKWYAVNMWYIYACATRPQYRKQGFMVKLLETVYHEACLKNVAGVFLHPANHHLANYYRKLGFEDFFYHNKIIFNRPPHTAYCLPHTSHRSIPTTYRIQRIEKLENTCFVNWNEDFFRFLNKKSVQFCEMENTIFSFSLDDKKIIVDELLGNLSDAYIANYLFEYHPEIETIEIHSQGDEICCGQIKWCNSMVRKLQNGYFAFAME